MPHRLSCVLAFHTVLLHTPCQCRKAFCTRCEVITNLYVVPIQLNPFQGGRVELIRTRNGSVAYEGKLFSFAYEAQYHLRVSVVFELANEGIRFEDFHFDELCSQAYRVQGDNRLFIQPALGRFTFAFSPNKGGDRNDRGQSEPYVGLRTPCPSATLLPEEEMVVFFDALQLNATLA